MRSFSLIILFLCIISMALASEDWMYTSDEALFVVEITESASIQSQSDDSRVEFVKGILDFFPREDYRQQVKTLLTFPESEKVGDSLVYEWSTPSSEKLDFSLYSQVWTRHYVVPVTKRVDFPLLFVEPELKRYVIPTKNIDADDVLIKQLASDLATGEDDLYQVVFEIADWVHANIEYRIAPETMDFAQKASWVLRNRFGVCDELTSLFAALVRSLGIPVKYVSGYAYGIQETLKPGPHAWAEVYFPDFGWIPFDVTYGEFGYVDVSHIKLRESQDADVPSSRYEWKAYQVDLETSKLDIKTTVLNTSGSVESPISFQLRPFYKEMGFGAYNYVETNIVNKNPYYATTQLWVSVPPELEVNPTRQSVLLNPNEEKSVYWIVHLKENLHQNYVYTLPFVMYSPNNSTMTVLIGASGFPGYLRSYIENAVREKSTPRSKQTKSQLSIQCTPEHNEFYMDETIQVDCWVRNGGNSPLKGVRVCGERSCESISLGVSQMKAVPFVFGRKEVGRYSLYFNSYSGRIQANDTVTIEVFERPRISISEVKHPETVSFDELYFVNFVLNKESLDNPQELLVIVNTEETTEGWDFEELNESQHFVVEMSGRSLRDGENPIKILVSYYDRHQRRYDEQTEVAVRLEDVTFGQHVVMWYDDFREWLSEVS